MPQVGVRARATQGPTGCLDDWILTLGLRMQKATREMRWKPNPNVSRETLPEVRRGGRTGSGQNEPDSGWRGPNRRRFVAPGSSSSLAF